MGSDRQCEENAGSSENSTFDNEGQTEDPTLCKYTEDSVRSTGVEHKVSLLTIVSGPVVSLLKGGIDTLPYVSLISTIFDRFEVVGHWCMVADLYGMSLRKMLDTEGMDPLQPRQVKAMAWQIVRAVACTWNSLAIT